MRKILPIWSLLVILLSNSPVLGQGNAERVTYFPDSLNTVASDSLWALDDGYIFSLQDSVLSDIEGLQTRIIIPLNQIQDPIKRMEDTMQQKGGEVKQKADNLQDKIKQKTTFQLELVSAEDGGFEEVGDASLQVDSPIPQIDVAFPEVDMPMPQAENFIPQLDMPEMSSAFSSEQAIGKAKGLAAEQLNGLGMPENSALIQKSGEIKHGIQTLSSGQMPDASMAEGFIENKLQSLDEVGAINEMTGDFGGELGLQDIGQVKDLMSPEEAREKAIQEARKRAIDHLAGRGKEVQAAQAQMAKLKSSYSSVNSAKDLPKRKPNQMKGKPFNERFIPGVGVEIFTGESLRAVDFAHHISYRFTGKVTSGISFIYRVHIGQDYLPYMTHSYAGRWHVDYGIRKGFFARAEAELFRTVNPLTRPGFFKSSDLSTWYPALYIGFGKNYKFVKKVKGQVVVHYNWLHQFQESPYPNKVNVRTYFNFKLPPKKVKQSTIE